MSKKHGNKGRRFDRAFKEEAVLLVHTSGRTQREIAGDLGISAIAAQASDNSTTWFNCCRSASRALNRAIALRQPGAGVIHHSDRGSQGRFNRSSQRFDNGDCDDYSKTTFGQVWAEEGALAWTAPGCAS